MNLFKTPMLVKFQLLNWSIIALWVHFNCLPYCLYFYTILIQYKYTVYNTIVFSTSTSSNLASFLESVCSVESDSLRLQAPLCMGFFQARLLELVVIFSSRGSSWPRDRTHIHCIGRWILYRWVTGEALSREYCSLTFVCPSIKQQEHISL